MGGDFPAGTLDEFARIVALRAGSKPISIFILPVGPGSGKSINSPEAERIETLKAAELLRARVEQACHHSASPGQKCSIVTLLPILFRSDAENPQTLQLLSGDPTAIYLLINDSARAMQVLQNSPLENALAEAYRRGVAIAGDGSGAVVQSATMLAGYSLSYDNRRALSFGAPDVWALPARHGLLFGIQNAILDQRFYADGNLGRLLNAISLPQGPHVGIGLDSKTGVQVLEESRLENIFGANSVTILDAETYHTADFVQYRGADYSISLRNVLVQLLSSGNYSYDLVTRQHSLKAPKNQIKRQYSQMVLPEQAGALFIAGGLKESLGGNAILTRFVNLCGGEKSKLLIIMSGFSISEDAMEKANTYQASLGIPVMTLIIPPDATLPPPLPENSTCMILAGDNPDLMKADLLAPVRDRWLAGVPLLTDGAASAVIGAYYAVGAPLDIDRAASVATDQELFQSGHAKILPGLGLLSVQIEPHMLTNHYWGRLFSLAFNQPDILALGLSDDSALEFSQRGPLALGENGIFVLDFSEANLALGNQGGFIVANGLLDLFAGGDFVSPETADIDAAPIHVATPDVASPTAIPPTPPMQPTATMIPSPSPTSIAAVNPPGRIPPTRIPRPTQLPAVVPPPTDPGVLHWMILLAGIAVLVVLLGIWINRRKLDLR